ncbi:GGDEF domain-containing protein [Anaerostipes sp.]|uniref:GGDEF domain-containing protein n=1 Tax=Anaerostipes sp. TaxID=1872530 RepID=UPI0025BD43B4|nr:GGDEF domain-containing protein [Anaerostipes sp.]MBS7009226.1 GGDEF domain-containing protein [Anaerostipes sp.]
MKKNKRIAATLLLLFLLGLVLAAAAKKYYAEGRERSFRRLTEYTQEAAADIQKTSENDRAYLQRAAKITAQYQMTDSKELRNILSELGTVGTISRVELLVPGDRLLTKDGTVDVSGELSFRDISKKGVHISRRSKDLTNPDKMILRYYMPVKKNGKTAAVLCGVTDLSKWPETLTVKGYGSDMQLFVIEGRTGDLLMDTWRTSLGNMNRFSGYSLKKGYSQEQTSSDFASGKPGTIVFHSQNITGYYYARYVPVGTQDWMVMLTVPERVAYAQADRMLYSFYIFAALLLVIFLFYLFWILWEIKTEKAESQRQIRNVQLILEIEKALFDAHIQPEHFAAALQKTAELLKAESVFLWLTDTEVLGKQYLRSGSQGLESEQNPEFEEILEDIVSVCQDGHGIVSCHMESFCRQFGFERDKYDRFNILSLTLIPVKGLEGNLAVILGAFNPENSWDTTEPLEQVALSFSMAVNHYEAHRALIRMGQIDSLTGLMNRNSFHADVETMKKGNFKSLACVYMDANGLHEINNYLGHQAGDEMLMAAADALRDSFTGNSIYRIGGDEFVVFCRDQDKEEVEQRAGMVRKLLTDPSGGISVGIEWRDKDFDIEDMVIAAETAMKEDKQNYYRENGNERQVRCLDQRMERIILEKRDADTFLSVLAPEFKGVYFVNLGSNKIRHLYIPSYFEEYLREAHDKFNDALLIYARRIVKDEYYGLFEQFCDYHYLEEQLGKGITPEFVYQRTDNEWLRLRVLKFKNYTEQHRETLWIFSSIGEPRESSVQESYI